MGTIPRENHKETFQKKFIFQENLYFLLQRNKGPVNSDSKNTQDGSVSLKGNGRDIANFKYFFPNHIKGEKKNTELVLNLET